MNDSHNTDETLRAPRIRVAPIIVKDNALLLVRHIKGERTYWLLPGGGVDYGETLGEALLREIKEETGLDAELGDLVMANDSIPPDGHRHVVNLFFTARVTGGTLQRGADWNLAEVRFVPFDELEHLTFFPDIRPWLLPALQAGFPGAALYPGNLWKD